MDDRLGWARMETWNGMTLRRDKSCADFNSKEAFVFEAQNHTLAAMLFLMSALLHFLSWDCSDRCVL